MSTPFHKPQSDPLNAPLRRIRAGAQLHPLLTEVLNDLEGTPLGDDLRRRAVDLVSLALIDSPVDRAEALSAHLWLLEQCEGEGLPLTEAGYLRPADVAVVAAVLPSMRDWVAPITREVNTHPVLDFRHHLKSLGLLRKYKSTLRLTRAGRAALHDVDLLWTMVADSLVPDSGDFEGMSAVIQLVHLATPPGRDELQTRLDMLSALGFVTPDGSSMSIIDVMLGEADVVSKLLEVGQYTDKGRQRQISRAARHLACDALFSEVTVHSTSF